MIEIKMTFATAAEAAAFLAPQVTLAPVASILGGAPSPAASASAPEPEKVKAEKPAKAPKAEPKTEAAAPTPAQAVIEKATKQEPQSEIASAPAKLMTYDESGIGPKIVAAIGKKPSADDEASDHANYAIRRGHVVKLLEEFGAKAGRDLKPEQFDAFIPKLNALLAPEEALG